MRMSVLDSLHHARGEVIQRQRLGGVVLTLYSVLGVTWASHAAAAVFII